MNYEFAAKWLRGFNQPPELVCSLYADDVLFEDPILDMSVTDQEDLFRAFAPFANDDPDNGYGIQAFRLYGYDGDSKSGLVRWEWTGTHGAAYLGVPTNGGTTVVDGQSFHLFDEDGRITRDNTYWDATAGLIALGHDVDKAVVRLPDGADAGRGGDGATAPAGTGVERAQAWASALSSDTDAVVGMYADTFAYTDCTVTEILRDLITTKDQLRERLAPFASVATHTFEVSEWLGNDQEGIAIWTWTGTGLESYRGVANPDGHVLQTTGQTWHRYGADGRIAVEHTIWNDVPVFQKLGIAMIQPHYWEADFDPASLAG